MTETNQSRTGGRPKRTDVLRNAIIQWVLTNPDTPLPLALVKGDSGAIKSFLPGSYEVRRYRDLIPEVLDQLVEEGVVIREKNEILEDRYISCASPQAIKEPAEEWINNTIASEQSPHRRRRRLLHSSFCAKLRTRSLPWA
jgi:hypothetical protein